MKGRKLIPPGVAEGCRLMSEQGQIPDVLVSELAGDEEFGELVDMFVEELPKRVSLIAKALAETKFEVLQALAHQLKGAAGGYGFPTISDSARAIEKACKGDMNLENLTAQVQEITAACRKARAR